MEDPVKEIRSVISLVTAAATPDIQDAAVTMYYTSNAEFRHPVCAVAAGENSRKEFIGILHWYRVMSPKIEIDAGEIFYNEENKTLICDVTQKFHIRFSPFKATPARLIVKLTLVEVEGKFYIAKQEDFYHPEDFLNLVLPPLAPFLRLALWGGNVVSNFNAKVAGRLGIW